MLFCKKKKIQIFTQKVVQKKERPTTVPLEFVFDKNTAPTKLES